MLKLKSNQSATKRLISQPGYGLICVRYRCDEEHGLHYKTIELIIETVHRKLLTPGIPGETVVGVKVGLQEVDLQTAVKQAGGKWNLELQLLELRHDKIVALGLTSRIEPSTLPNSGKIGLANSRQVDHPYNSS